MFQEKLSSFEENFEEEKIEAELNEEIIDEEIKENPQGFLNWFENLKNSIGEWPKSFFENKTIKNAIIYASIPFAVLSATKQEIKAEDVVSEFVNRPTITQQVESKEMGEYEIKSDALISVADGQQREVLAARINQELFAFDKLSDSFNEALKERISENKNSIPQENYESIVSGTTAFDFAGRMKYKINEASDFFEEISSIQNNEVKKYKIEEHNKNIFQDGREIFRILPKAIFAQKFSVLVHELGHEKEALKWGATNVQTKFSFLGGYTLVKGMKEEGYTSFKAAGINADKAYGEFLVNNLREQDAPSQLLAIMALVAKSDGMIYALGTNFLTAYKEHKGNDIIGYAEETNASVAELATGLTADFLFDRDNWNLISMALGKEGVKIPQTTIAPFYELGDRGPIVGIKFKGVF